MNPVRPLAPTFLLAVSLAGCAGTGATPPDQTRGAVDEPALRRALQSATAGKSNVNVRVVDGVAIVSGFVETAIDENAVLRAAEGSEGVVRVENLLQRNM